MKKILFGNSIILLGIVCLLVSYIAQIQTLDVIGVIISIVGFVLSMCGFFSSKD